MAKKTLSFADIAAGIEDSADVRTVSAYVIIAMGQYKNKDLNALAFAGVLRKASDKIYSISNL